MAAYGALVSVMHIIQQIQQHPLPPISLHQKQVESLIQNLTFLQDFLEAYECGGSKEGAAYIESCIADAAYAAEDLIESHIMEIHSGSTSHGENISSIDFYHGLEKVIQDMELIKKEAMQIKEKMGVEDARRRSATSRSSAMAQSIIVGLDDLVNEIKDKLIGEPSNRLVIPVVGMGGIGKTTLARNLFVSSFIREYFGFSAWVTFSVEYNVREIFLEVLHQLNSRESREMLSQLSESELGDKMFKSLWGRRYFVVMDDVWSVEAWDKVKIFFPDNKNGSRIMITTRLHDVASKLSDESNVFKMKFLDEEKSWDLFCKNVFGDKDCPLELGEIGTEIAKNCKGLPLSIVVIGGLLAQSQKTPKYWKEIAENLSSIVNLEENERCLKILHTSYNQLPIHLKPCFLYMGIYPQNHVVRVSLLVKLWVSEGFLKRVSGKSLEAVAEEYLNGLIDRNLIIARKLASDGKVKFCKIHDLLRDLCIREACKENFRCVARQNGPRCFGVHQSMLKEENLPRFVSLFRLIILSIPTNPPLGLLSLLRLMRAMDKHMKEMEYTHSLQVIFQLVNLRYLDVKPHLPINSLFPSSVYLLWNLQTLIVHSSNLIAPSEIWNMPRLRHVMFGVLDLPDPPLDGGDHIVLKSLQTLMCINNFKCGDEVVKRIPNVKKLKVYYEAFEQVPPNYYLNNLACLDQLECLSCSFTSDNTRNYLLENLTFPHSLKKLTMESSFLHWEDMARMIGPLPCLQVLKLRFCAFIGSEWETIEGQFCSLKFLMIDTCLDFESWITENSHFPCLEHIVIRDSEKLKEIPLEIGDIPTLQSIELDRCSDSAVVSAKKIMEDQEELGNVGLRVRVKLWKINQELERLASHNFEVSR